MRILLFFNFCLFSLGLFAEPSTHWTLDDFSLNSQDWFINNKLDISLLNCDLAAQKKETFSLGSAAATILSNKWQELPYKSIKDKHFGLIEIGNSAIEFKNIFKLYAKTETLKCGYNVNSELSAIDSNRFSDKVNTFIVLLNDIKLNPDKDYEFFNSLYNLTKEKEVLLLNFGKPENLLYLDTSYTIIQAFSPNTVQQSQVAQIIFGGAESYGNLPDTYSDLFTKGMGDRTGAPIRLKYTIPEEVGIAAEKLERIDAIAKEAISSRATPGCQVLIAKDGKVFYHKAFGHLDYSKEQETKLTHLYDVASVTKAFATTVAAMKLFDEGKLRMNVPFRYYLDTKLKTNIGEVEVKDFFTHKSGLQANMPVGEYMRTKPHYLCNTSLYDCTCKIADGMYFNTQYIDTIFAFIHQIQPNTNKNYIYSDVNFNVVLYIIETLADQRLDMYLDEHFFSDLGLQTACFNPLEQYSYYNIAPTIDDTQWRNQVLRGYVHDEAAALFGGVGGNAGLFSNANDLAVIAEMLLNRGTYAGTQFLNGPTVDHFTGGGHGNHRGLGFDRKTDRSPSGCSDKASPNTFGHSGFTGTCVWVDPEEKLTYVFLSNRVHPNRNNFKLSALGTRKRIHDVVYKSLNSFPD